MNRKQQIKRISELYKAIRDEYAKLKQMNYEDPDDMIGDEINRLYEERIMLEEPIMNEEKRRYGDYYINNADKGYIVWDTDKECRKITKQSVLDTNENDVALFIEKCREVIKNTNVQIYESNLNDLEIVNTAFRHNIVCCDVIIAIDLLENDCIWNVSKEPFATCLNKIARQLDIDMEF